MAREEMEYGTFRIGKPAQSDIIIVEQRRQNHADGSFSHIAWKATLWLRDLDGETVNILGGVNQYACEGTSPSYPTPLATVLTVAESQLENNGFASV